MSAAAWLPAGDTLDVRPTADFRTGHFERAVHVPLSRLEDSIHLLPPRRGPLWVFGAPEEVAEARARLAQRGYEDTRLHPAAGEFASPEARFDDRWVSGDERVRLWQPTPFLAEILEAQPPRGPALDVACGGGRDAAYLALAGLAVTGADRLPDALERARDLGARMSRAVAERRRQGLAPEGEPPRAPNWVRADLERAWPFGPGRFAVVSCMRFLYRPLLPGLAAALRPGGWLVCETFTRQQARFGKPRHPEHLLEPGEFAARFAELGLEIRLARESCPPGGPALASLWAVRPG